MRTHFFFSKKFVLVASVTIVVFMLAWSLFWSVLTFTALRAQKIDVSARQAQRARFFVRPFSSLTLRKISSVEVWRSGLEEVRLAHELSTQTESVLQRFFTLPDAGQTPVNMMRAQELVDALDKNTTYLYARAAASHLLQTKNLRQLANLAAATHDANIVFNELTTGSQSALVLFQNSEELRATGGFVGSFGEFRWQDGQLVENEIQDIYEPDGQFRGFVDAPAGATEYLSGGNGLRLPDANWWPNFPNSAQQILTFFSGVGRTDIQHVVTVNVSVVEDILRVVDGVYLPSARTTVTAENFTTLARADRSEFFAGSQQKQIFLSSVFTQLKIKLATLSPQQKIALAKILWQKLVNKEIQLYSANPTLQKIWRERNWAGEIHPTQTPLFLFPVESNVGINKANKKIERAVTIEKRGDLLQVTLTIRNQNSRDDVEPPVPPLTQARPLDYANYQRFLLPVDVTIQKIEVENAPLTDYKTEIIDLVLPELPSQQIQQIGFFVAVPAQTEKTIRMTVTLPASLSQQRAITLYKQSGAGNIPYSIQWDGTPHELLLEKDEQLTFEIQ